MTSIHCHRRIFDVALRAPRSERLFVGGRVLAGGPQDDCLDRQLHLPRHASCLVVPPLPAPALTPSHYRGSPPTGNAIKGGDLVNFLIGLEGASTLTTTKYNKTTTTKCAVLGLIEEVDAHNEGLEV